MADGEYQFVAWVRTGMGAVLGGAPRTVRIELGTAGAANVLVSPHGPGDAMGLAPGAVVRMVPAPDTNDFEPNLFAAVELAHPALPWAASPPGADPERTTPWLVLVVVEDRPGVRLEQGRERSILVIDTPADASHELPDLAQAWAWAHAQAIAPSGAPIDEADLARSGGEGRARLLCPRRLAPNARYLACVVPAFAAGVAAGLGLPVPEGTELAWAFPPVLPVQLPVFHAWRFGTGDGGDFASLAARLGPQQLAESVGHRRVDASDPGWGIAPAPELAIDVPGALVSPQWKPSATPAAAAAMGDAILQAIDAAASPPAGEVPVYPPPFYGATATRTTRTADSPAWQDELNRDVPQRIAASLGATVVRAEQDELVDAAWRAAGDAERATTLVRHAQLAVAVGQRLVTRHVAALADDGELVALARPLLARTLMAGASDGARRTVASELARSAMPTAALSPSLRRLARPGGVIARQGQPSAGRMLARVDGGTLEPAPAAVLPDGAVAFDAVSSQVDIGVRLHDANVAAIDAARVHWSSPSTRRVAPTRAAPARTIAMRRATEIPDAEVGDLPPLVSVDPGGEIVDAFADAARRHQSYLFSLTHPPRPPRPLGALGDARPLAGVRATILARLDPGTALSSLLDAQISNVAPSVVGGLEPVVVRPVLERPLVQLLAKQGLDHILPSIDSLLFDRAALAVADSRMVRAFLVGANDELGRELLWRGFPGALGHTWLRTFWGRTKLAPTGPVALPDIDAIETWPDAGPAIEPAPLVLVVRSELLRRYPNALVYALPATWSGRYRIVGNAPPLVPVIAQALAPGIAVFGFDLDEATARGADVPGGPAGWYFIIEEHPAEPRFGLAALAAPSLASWRDLAWDNLTETDLVAGHVRVDGLLAQVRPTDDGGLRWGSNAADLAAITMRRPSRVAMHASLLLSSS